MTWTVKNNLRGTLELHGFLPLDQPVRIAGGQIFDLDSLGVQRQELEESRQLQIAFKEGYLETQEKNNNKSESHVQSEVKTRDLLRWQTEIQNRLNTQASHLDQLSGLMQQVIQEVSKIGEKASQPSNLSLDAEALQKILRRESQNQVQAVTQALRQQQNFEMTLTEQEADNRARLLEDLNEDMDVEVGPQRKDGVTQITSEKDSNKKMVDLLSNLGGADL